MNGTLLVWIAALLSGVTFSVHTFVGTRFAVPPLVAAEAQVGKAGVWLNYLCWHIATGMLLVLTLVLAAAASGALSADVVLVAALLFGCVSLVSLIATTQGGIPFYRFPASYLGAASALTAFAGWLV